jgi:3-dehydroquinate synthase
VRAGKNLVGSFHQPALVVIDPTVLDTLPDRQMRAGYAEIVKYGLINDPAFFDWCDTHAAAVLRRDPAALATAIAQSVTAKAKVVAADERELNDLRALLNLGHTFGHALEAETGFSDKLLHGEAVATGMALAYGFSAKSGRCAVADAQRVTDHLARHGLPASLQAANIHQKGATLVQHMLHDKKMTGGTLPFILARGIGQSYVDHDVDLADVAAFLDGVAA